MQLSTDDYRRLLAFRTGLRQFLHWSEEQAITEGITPAQHQLMLAVRGSAGGADPTIGELSEALLLRHHSAVELVDRAEQAGLVTRHRDRDDGRVVRVGLSSSGKRLLERLARRHLDELEQLAPTFRALIRQARP